MLPAAGLEPKPNKLTWWRLAGTANSSKVRLSLVFVTIMVMKSRASSSVLGFR